MVLPELGLGAKQIRSSYATSTPRFWDTMFPGMVADFTELKPYGYFLFIYAPKLANALFDYL